MEEEYYKVSLYLDQCRSHYVYIKTLEGKPKKGLAIISEDHPKHIQYIQFKTPDEKGNDHYEYAYLAGASICSSVIRYKDHPLERLHQLCQATGSYWTHKVSDAITIAEIYKGLTVSMDVFRHSYTLTNLGLANPVNVYINGYRKMKFMDNPPNFYG
jgi:hypothetical protein